MANNIAHFPAEIRALAEFDGPFDAFRLPGEHCDVLFASYPARTSIPTHSHPTNNVGVITKGMLILTIDGEQTSYGTGDWYHVPPGVDHSADFEVDSAEIEFWFRSHCDRS